MIPTSYSQPSPFPPSFEGEPVAYALGLFGDIVAASLALTMLLAIVLEKRRHREVSRRVRNLVQQVDEPLWTPLFLYRAATVSMLLFVVMRTLPDAIWMLAWGEVSEPTIRNLLTLDLLSDSFALAPFFFSILCWTWGRHVIPQQLIKGAGHVHTTRPPWSLIWKNGRIVLVVLVIAMGVTVGKAAGA